VPTCRIACLAAIAALCCGCGTLVNIGGGIGTRPENAECEVYGGVKSDLGIALYALTKGSSKDDKDSTASTSSEKSETALTRLGSFLYDFEVHCLLIGFSAGYLAVDLPLSIVGDTLTLPITLKNKLEKRSKQSTEEPMDSPR
jgi:uncharacterized protein YceK